MDELLLDWYGTLGRDLPWRRTRDPYAILVSEVMLQQTQVDRVVPRWTAWLERWPTVDALAAASPADVIREWQGLGYNRRALNLHRAAQQVAERTAGPTISPSCPASGATPPTPSRASRTGATCCPSTSTSRRVAERTGHTFTAVSAQALMDLGATVCLARIPRCDVCPLADGCPSRGRRYEPLRKQSAFEGSFRQRRSETLRLVAAAARPAAELDPEAVASLAKDGLVQLDGPLVSLPA